MRRETVLKKLAALDNGRTSLNYRKRSNYFQNYKNSCGFDADTMQGHSYGWYTLSKRIKGKVVLNNYSYSNQTAKHVNHFRRVFGDLGIRFIELPAPRGLQNLDDARDYIAYKLEEAILKNIYARKKSNYWINHWNKIVKRAHSIGITFPENIFVSQSIRAQGDRARRLERQKQNRIRRKEYLTKQQLQKPALQLIVGGA